MKLSPSQIEYINHYVVSKDIKWYELQMELTDHLVMEMERIWEQSPELSFHQVMNQSERLFGRNGFKEIETERTEILRKQYRKQHFTLVKEYLKFPKIIGSVLLGFLVYQVSFYFEKPHKFMSFLFLMLILFSLPTFYNWLKIRFYDKKRFLEMEFFNAYSGIMAFPQLGVQLTLSFKDEIQNNQLFLIPFVCLWLIGLLSCGTAMYLDNKIVDRIKNQYLLN
jgi:hypothetical protein